MAGVPHRLAIAWVLLLAAAAAHAERKVYKCTGADGVVVFSEQACGRDAQELNVDTGRAEPPPAPVVAQPADTSTPPRTPKKRGAPDSLRDISDGVDDANCRRDAERLAVIGDDGRLDDLVRRKENVASEINSNTSALGTAWGQRQIAILEVAIEQERSRISLREMQAQAVSRAALAKCDAAKAAREKNRAQ
jgi:hypothetical protein